MLTKCNKLIHANKMLKHVNNMLIHVNIRITISGLQTSVYVSLDIILIICSKMLIHDSNVKNHFNNTLKDLSNMLP